MATASSHARLSNSRGLAVPPGTLTLVGPTPFGSGVLSGTLTHGSTIASHPIVIAASPTYAAQYGYITGGGGSFGNVPTLALLNNGTTKQCVAISSGVAPAGVGGTVSAITLTCAGINVSTYQGSVDFTPGNTTVSVIPAEYITSGSTTYLSAADAPPAVGGSCNRYTVTATGLPNVTLDMAESTHPTTPAQIILKIGAEVFPYANFAPYSFENSGLNIVQNIVSASGGLSSIMLEAIFSGGNAWNNNTGLLIGNPKGAVHLAARIMSLISYVYNQYCLTTGSHYPSGASGNLPLTVWAGSGSSGAVMLCCQYYGLGWRKDILVTKFLFDAPGATFLTYREMSGLAGDSAYNPVVAAGSSANGVQVVAEGLLDDQCASFPPSAGGNYFPDTLQPVGGLGDGQGPSYQSLFTSGWGPGGAYAGTVGALTVASTFNITSTTAPATFTASGTATGWPGASSAPRDVNGIVTIPLAGGGNVLCSYHSITTGSPNTFNGCTWSVTGTVNSGASLQCGGTAFGYAAAGANLANESDGPMALPATVLHPNSLTRQLRFVMGQNDTSNLPILINTWLPKTALSPTKYLWQVVPNAPHDVSSTLAGATAIEAHLFDQPTVLQNTSQNSPGSTTSVTMPGWKVNGTNVYGTLVNEPTIIFAVIWSSTTNLPVPPVTTNSPASGINAWTRVPAGISGSSYACTMNSGTYGLVTVWSKVTTGGEVAADWVFTHPTSGTIYCFVTGEVGIGLDNPALNSNITVMNASSSSSGISGYGIDNCGAAPGVHGTTLTAPTLAPTGTAREVTIAFVCASIAGNVTTPVTPTNGYSSTLLNGTASYSTITSGPDGSATGVLGIAQKNTTSSSTTSFTVTASGTTYMAGGWFTLKGSIAR